MATGPIRDFALDENGDLLVVNGDFVLIGGADAVKQGIRIRVLQLLGEVWLDETLGVDYLGQILIKNANPDVVRDLVATAIESVPDVTDVVAASLIQNPDRTASIAYTVRSIYSTTPIDGTVPLP